MVKNIQYSVHVVYGWPPDSSWYRQNEITLVMTLISMIVPNIFDIISLLEDYHPRKAMRWMLARIMVLNLLSLYTLIFALFGKTFVIELYAFSSHQIKYW